MNKKKKTGLVVLAIMLLMPMFGGMVMTPQADVSDVSLEPVKDFGLSANPTIGTAAICTNPDTTDNMYGGNYKTYLITANITDSDQAADIANVTIIFKGTTELVSMQWLNSTNVWAEVAGTSAVTTFTGTGTNTTDANDMNITLSIQWDWTFPDTDDIDIVIQIYATDGTEVNDTANVNYEVDTDLTLASTTFFTNAAEGDGSPMTVNTLTYSYEDSAGEVFPLAAQTDFWVTRSAATTGTPVYAAESFEANAYVDATGVATWLPILSKGGGEHTETFTLLAVKQSAGSAGTTLMGATKTDTVSIEYSGVRTHDGIDLLPITDIPSEQVGIIAVIVIVVGGIGYFAVSKNSGGRASGGRRKTTKRKTIKRKATKRKRRK